MTTSTSADALAALKTALADHPNRALGIAALDLIGALLASAPNSGPAPIPKLNLTAHRPRTEPESASEAALLAEFVEARNAATVALGKGNPNEAARQGSLAASIWSRIDAIRRSASAA